MMKINTLLKIFDRELIEVLALNSAGIAFLLVNYYDFSAGMALLLSPVISVSLFLGLIAIARFLSMTFELVEKGSSYLKN